MGEYKFGITGKERKSLVAAISEILNAPTHYHGTPNFDYTVGEYHIDKEGAVTGEFNPTLFEELKNRGFVYEGYGAEENAEPETEMPTELAIEIPLSGYDLTAIENLRKMVNAKQALIKKALGAENLFIQVLEDRIRFPWFKIGTDGETVKAYAQFITQLCKTAKAKKRVTAKAHETFENEKFAMRVWLIGLGMVGDDFKTARKLLMQNLSGNGAWRYGAPGSEEAPAPEAGVMTNEAANAPDIAEKSAHAADEKGVA